MKFLRLSTYERDDAAERRQKAGLRQRVIQAYDNPIIRWYCALRFHIINIDFLDTLEQHLAPEARVLDIGCGFGLFSLYYALNGPSRAITGFDLSRSRILAAQRVASRLNLTNAHFFCQDAERYEFDQDYDAVVTLDLLHHVTPEAADRLLRQAYQALTPGGVLLIKDVNTRPLHKLWFTYALDKLMMLRSHVHYRSASLWRRAICEAGFSQAVAYPLNDYLPYPHVLIVARK
ncbi:MAG: class I SAM-dependent methyltransferase [Anaerolineae bacterium]|nr:class I SAM-dependent methyltransferase [Anaerolineae bacterium]